MTDDEDGAGEVIDVAKAAVLLLLPLLLLPLLLLV